MTQGQNAKIGGYKLSSKQAQWYWRYNYVHKTIFNELSEIRESLQHTGRSFDGIKFTLSSY